MGLFKDKGNADDFTHADILNWEAERAGISDPAKMVEITRTFIKDRQEAHKAWKIAARACKNQGGGKLAELKPVKGGWAVVITGPEIKKKK